MSKTILVIEDEAAIREDLENILRLSGFNPISCSNGTIGLEYAIQYMPDLVICDIMLPDINGYDILNNLQDNHDTSQIPFLFLSAKSSSVHIREGMLRGADDYITKPYDINELIDAVNIRLKKKESIASEYDRKIDNLNTSVQRNLPHEIRTPINIILGLSEFLLKNFDKTEKSDFIEMLENIYDSGKRLNRLFENYLFFAKLELINTTVEEKKKLRNSKSSLVYYHIKDLVYAYLKAHGRYEDLKLDLEDATLAISEFYLSKLVIEIIDNAVKFSTPGTPIKIYSKIEKNMYLLSFTDYGRGMTKEQIDNVDAYMQFERKIHEQQGNGLGLSIVKNIVTLHNGRFQINSQPKLHTTIEIELPLAKDRIA